MLGRWRDKTQHCFTQAISELEDELLATNKNAKKKECKGEQRNDQAFDAPQRFLFVYFIQETQTSARAT